MRLGNAKNKSSFVFALLSTFTIFVADKILITNLFTMKRFTTCLSCVALLAHVGFSALAADNVGRPAHIIKRQGRMIENANWNLLGDHAKDEYAKAVIAKERTGTPAYTKAKTEADTGLQGVFYCDFETEESFNDNWTVINANGDNRQWIYDNTNYDSGVALCYSGYVSNDDYLVTTNPVTLEAGDAFFSIDYCSGSYQWAESYEILYGSTADVSEMKPIATYNDFITQSAYIPEQDIVNFFLNIGGDYYFAIHYNTPNYAMGMWVDNIEIGNGKYMGTIDASVVDIQLPEPSVSLSDAEKVSIIVSNQGSCDIASFTLSCIVEVDDKQVANESHAVEYELPMGESVQVELPSTFDFSTEGIYTVTASVGNVQPTEDANVETALDDNTLSASTTHFTVTDVPFTTNFLEGENRDRWASTGYWGYDPYYGIMCGTKKPLYSQGLNLTAGKKYRFEYNFMAGYDLFGLQTIYETYDLKLGMVGSEDMATLLSRENVYTLETFMDDWVEFTPATSGVYYFAFSQEQPYGSFCIRSISVTEVGGHDLSLSSVSGCPTMLPVQQFGSVQVDATISNNGLNDCGGTLAVSLGGTELATVAIPVIEAGKEATVPVAFSIPASNGVNGELIDIEFVVTLDGQEDFNEADNSMVKSIIVSDGELAYDHATNDMYNEDYTIGISGGGNLVVAVPFKLGTDDVLTGFSIGWGKVMEQEIQLSVCKYNPDEVVNDDYYGTYYEIGEEVFSTSVPQGDVTGQIKYETEPTQLEAGDYMACVGYSDYCLVCDQTAPGKLYLLSGTKLLDQGIYGYGTAAVRVILGEESSGIENAEDVSLRLYPNPASNAIVISAAGKEIRNVQIYSASGASIGSVAEVGTEVRYDVSGLAPGVYIAKVATDSGTEVLRFMVK